jgi:predicted metal-dependent peptidase
VSEKVREALKNVRLTLARTSPLFFFQLSSLRITYVPKYSYLCKTCGAVLTSDELVQGAACRCGGETMHLGGISVNADGLWLWKDWDSEPNFLGVIKHELLHWMLQHTLRGRNMIKKLVERGVERGAANVLYNLAADVKVNQMLFDAGERLTHAYSCYDVGLDPDRVRKMSVEEIVEFMLRKDPRGTGACAEAEREKAGKDIIHGHVPVKRKGERKEQPGKGEGEAEAEGEVIQDWSAGLKEAKEQGEEKFAEAVQRKVVEDIMKAKVVTAGSGHGSLLLQIQAEVVKPEEVAWWIKLYNSIKSELMKTVVQDWTRTSRRLGVDYPGLRVIRKPRVYCCVDVSGSVYMRPEVYKKLIGVMLRIAQMADVYAVFWDTAHSKPIKVLSEEDLRAKVEMEKISGAGGTEVTCLHDIFTKEAKAGDIIVVLTDGCFFDRASSVEEMVGKCRALNILCWTDRDWECFKQRIKVKVSEG